MSQYSPLISVIIPVFNTEKYILRALKSVAGQTYKNYEIIVVDDGSTDGSLEKTELFKEKYNDIKIKLIRQIHGGPAKARNSGIRSSKGDLISFLDADNYWMPDKLKKTIEFFYANKEIDLVCHSEILIDSLGNEKLLEHHKKYVDKINPFVSMYCGNCLTPSAVTVKKKRLLETNLFDENLKSVEEYDLWLQLSKSINFRFLREPLSYNFLNPNGLSRNLELRLKYEPMILKRYLPDLKKFCKFPRLTYLKRVSQVTGAVGRDYFERGYYKKAFKNFLYALFLYPLNYKIFIYPFYLTFIAIKANNKTLK